MNSRLRQYFITGLLTVTPLAITGWILWRFYRVVDDALRPLLERIVFLREYVPPFLVTLLGVLVSLLLLVLIGLVTRTLIGVAFFGLFERIINRIPIIKSIFSVTKQISGVLLADNRQAFQHVVMFEYPRRGIWSLGFITHDDPQRDNLHIFLPTAPNPTSGFLLLVPRAEALILPMTVEEGIRLVISGGAVVERAGGGSLAPLLTRRRRTGIDETGGESDA
ncbi:DUF502 domain-containing protein [bacterium]|nr:DUF502 domain-containing protein [bacterium]MBU1071654.1 DUF502 domain-containing protein [bacterium]MBU1674184.1 DUF502 domain-containing protein [bacterium]